MHLMNPFQHLLDPHGKAALGCNCGKKFSNGTRVQRAVVPAQTQPARRVITSAAPAQRTASATVQASRPITANPTRRTV